MKRLEVSESDAKAAWGRLSPEVSAEAARIIGARDYYEVLGVGASATPEELKKAYNRLALLFHPDRWNSTPFKGLAESLFKKVREAYETLSDPEKRSGYNPSAGSAAPGSSGVDVDDYEAVLSKVLGRLDWRRCEDNPRKFWASLVDEKGELFVDLRPFLDELNYLVDNATAIGDYVYTVEPDFVSMKPKTIYRVRMTAEEREENLFSRFLFSLKWIKAKYSRYEWVRLVDDSGGFYPEFSGFADKLMLFMTDDGESRMYIDSGFVYSVMVGVFPGRGFVPMFLLRKPYGAGCFAPNIFRLDDRAFRGFLYTLRFSWWEPDPRVKGWERKAAGYKVVFDGIDLSYLASKLKGREYVFEGYAYAVVKNEESGQVSLVRRPLREGEPGCRVKPTAKEEAGLRGELADLLAKLRPNNRIYGDDFRLFDGDGDWYPVFEKYIDVLEKLVFSKFVCANTGYTVKMLKEGGVGEKPNEAVFYIVRSPDYKTNHYHRFIELNEFWTGYRYYRVAALLEGVFIGVVLVPLVTSLFGWSAAVAALNSSTYADLVFATVILLLPFAASYAHRGGCFNLAWSLFLGAAVYSTGAWHNISGPVNTIGGIGWAAIIGGFYLRHRSHAESMEFGGLTARGYYWMATIMAIVGVIAFAKGLSSPGTASFVAAGLVGLRLLLSA